MKCHFEGCEELGEFTCQQMLCMNNEACGEKMCMKHKSKAQCLMKQKGGPEPTVCLKCEPEAVRKSRCFCSLFFIMPFLICGCLFFLSIVNAKEDAERNAKEQAESTTEDDAEVLRSLSRAATSFLANLMESKSP